MAFMSGITGIFRRDGKDVDPSDIKKMNDKIAHRGPDGSKVWCEGPVAFGHQMLHTTPESLHEILPFEDEESGLVITADARIDNREDLAPKLGIEDNEHVSDSYFILKAYDKWGEKCPEELLGDFAFVIWDKNRKTLFCARDHMGVKPFYYYLSDDVFLFSTEMKGIIAFDKVLDDLNKQMIAFFVMNITDYKSTFYSRIFHLTPAFSLKIDFNEFKKNEYWNINPSSEIILESEEEYAEKFRKLFEKAVKCRLRSVYPLGFELSGGMDSSSVVCMAKRILNSELNSSSTKIKTFSFIFDEFKQSDERYYIKKIVKANDIDSIYLKADNISPLSDLNTIFYYQEQPVSSPHIAITWNLYKKIKSNNIRVILCGEGGDSIVSHGDGYFSDLLVNFQFKKLFQETSFLSQLTNKSMIGILISNAVYPNIPSYIKKWKSSDRLNSLSLLHSDFSKKIDAEKDLKLYWKSIKQANSAKKKHFYSVSHNRAIINALLLRDKRAAAFNVEDRYPFLDKRLVEFCYAIPTEMKFKFGWSRYILRIAMTGILPIENQWRVSKANLNPVYKKNLLMFEKKILEQMIFHDKAVIDQYVDIDVLREIYEKYIDGTGDSEHLYAIWLVLQLYLWLKRNSDFSEKKN